MKKPRKPAKPSAATVIVRHLKSIGAEVRKLQRRVSRL